MSFVYTIGVPNPPNNPSADVPKMQTNTTSIYNLINVDHVPFNNSNGGKHKQVQIQQVAALPAGLVSGFNTIYSKSANPGPSGQLFFTQGSSGNQVQLTAATTGVPTTAANGVSFLPGGLLIQWGTALNVTAVGVAVTFTRAFSGTVYSVVSTSQSTSSVSTGVTGVSSTGFTARIQGIGSFSVYWIAIGPA